MMKVSQRCAEGEWLFLKVLLFVQITFILLPLRLTITAHCVWQAPSALLVLNIEVLTQF